MRPIANAVRLDTFTPAFALAMVEFTMARKIRIQNSPYNDRAIPSHDDAPELEKLAKSSGPKATVTA